MFELAYRSFGLLVAVTLPPQGLAVQDQKQMYKMCIFPGDRVWPLNIPHFEPLPQKLEKRDISLKWHMGCVCVRARVRVCACACARTLCWKDMI